MNAAVMAVVDNVLQPCVAPKPGRRVSRKWLCHVSVRVAHSCPLVAAGLVATLQQLPGYDVVLDERPGSDPQPVLGVVHVLITDRPHGFGAGQATQSGFRDAGRPRTGVVLLSNDTSQTLGRCGLKDGVDACLPIDCATEDLLAAVRQLGHSALGPLVAVGPEGAFDRPARGGLAPSVLRKVRKHIEDHLVQGADIDSLARVAGLSCCHFSRAFKRSTGMPAHHYLITRRVSAAIALIRESNRSLCEISLEVGFADQSHFTRTFLQLTGFTPGDFRHRTH